MTRLPRTVIISSERFPHRDTSTQQVIKNSTSMHAAGLPVELWVPPQPQGFFNKKYVLTQVIAAFYNVPIGLKIREFGIFPSNDLRTEKFTHSFGAFFAVLFNRSVDLVYTRNKVVALLCLFFGKKFVFETYRKLGDDHPRAMRFLAKKCQRGNTFLGMVLHSKVAADSMLRAGFPKEKLLVLHNGYDASDMLPRHSKAEARQHLGLPTDEQYVVYTGNMQSNKCVESVIDIAAHLPHAKFLLVGGTPEDVERLTAHAATVGAANVLLPGHQPISEISDYLYAADVLIIPPAGDPLEKFGKTVLPFKIFPYLAAGRAIVAPDQPDMRELLTDGENALLVPVDAPAANAKAIKNLLGNVELMQRLSANAVVSSESLTWEVRGRKLVKWLAEKWQ